jgi:hypothetical protein
MVAAVGLEPTNPAKDAGVVVRCVCQFHHAAGIENEASRPRRQSSGLLASLLIYQLEPI